MTSAHVIEELRFDVNFASEDEAFEVQERLLRFAQGRAQQVIAEVFDQVNEPDAILRLEKLEVDIGTVTAVDFEDQFAERLRDELHMVLRDRRAQLRQSVDLGLPADADLSVGLEPSSAERRALELHLRPPEAGKSQPPSVDHLTTGAHAELEWLLHFIEHGCLPWHAPPHLCRDMHALAARVLETNGVQLARALRPASDSQWHTTFRRLVAQFPAEWLAELGRQIGLAKRPPGPPARLHQRGYITNPVTKAKLIGLTDAGMRDTAIAAGGATIDAATCSAPDAAAHSDVLSEVDPAVPGDAREGLARSRTRVQIESVLGEPPGSDLALVESVPVSADTWRRVLRDDAPWINATLLRLGRSIRVRRRLAAVLPVEVVPELLALWLSPAQVDVVLGMLGADTAPFAREVASTDISREAISAPRLLATLTHILVDGGDSEFNESGYRHSLASQAARLADEALGHDGIFAGSIPAPHSSTEPLDKARGSPPTLDAPRTLPEFTHASSLENRISVAANLEDQPATDAAAEAFALSNSPAAADQNAHPDAHLLSHAAVISDAVPKTSTTVHPDVDLTAHLAPDFTACAAAHSDTDLTMVATGDSAARTPGHSKAILEVESAVPDAAHFRANSKPTEVAALSPHPLAGSEIPRAADTVAHDDLPETLARSQARAQIEAVLGESPESGCTLVSSMPVAADTWRVVLRDDASWLKATLLRLGRGIRARRRLVAMLPKDAVPDLLALLEFSPASLLENGISAVATLALQPAIDAATDAGENAFAIFNSTAVAEQDASSDAQAATPTRLADSTAGATPATAPKSPPPYDDDLLRHLRGDPTPGSTINVLRQMLRVLLDQRSAAARHALLSALEYPRAAHRCAALLAVGDLPNMLHWLRPTDGAIALAVAARVTKLGRGAGDHTTSRRDEAPGLSSPAVGGIDTEKHTDTAPYKAPDVLAHVVNELLLTDLFEEGRTLDPESLARRLTVALGATLSLRAQSESAGPEGARPSHFARTIPRIPADSSQVQAASQTEDDTVTQRIYIGNAGVVIVGPYLPTLFSMLGLTSKGAFATLRSAHRAVHLIQYIVTRSTVTPEPLLVLNKILCGLPVSAPIPLEIDLRAPEQAAIEAMLTAVIAHWKAIGSTSIAGLRESFLQREGRLVFCDDAWRLRVESKCFDMLLDRLPWGYATVKFPWMKRVLHVDWR